jgi:hypothetical protein
MASFDKVVYPFSQKQDILQLLEEHITENIVKVVVISPDILRF